MIPLHDFAGPKSLNWVFGLSFAGLIAVIMANVMSLLFMIPEVSSFASSNSSGWIGEFIDQVRTSHPLLQASNIVICFLGLFVVVLLRQALQGAQFGKIISVENARRIAWVAAALLVMEMVGSLARFYIFDDKLTYLKSANYIGIGCIVILAYVLFRAARTRDNDGII